MLKNPVIGVGTYQASPRAKELVMQALDTNRLSYGPMTQQFEEQFSKLHGCRFGVMSNSGTSALHVALATLKEMHSWEDGDEILVPAVTFVATSNIVIHNNMRPVFVDVEPQFYSIDTKAIEGKITPRTRAIIPVHLFGHPADMDPILDIASRYGLKVIEDTCETMFARYNGRSVGSMGDIGCFSTYVAHLIVTGVGGLNTTNDIEYAIKLRSLVNHGRDSIYLNIDDDDDRTPEELRVLVPRRFSFVSVGHSFRVTEMESALGIAQLEEWEPMIAKRRSNAQHLIRELSPYEDRIQVPSIRPGCEHSFMMFPIVLRDQSKTELVNYLEERGVETRDMMPLVSQPVYRDLLNLRPEDYPVADWITQNGFYIGCHQNLMESDLGYITELFARFWKPRASDAKKQKALLVLIINDNSYEVGDSLELLPLELFDEVVALTDQVSGDEKTLLAQHGIPEIPYHTDNSPDFPALDDVACENVIFYPIDGSCDARDIAKILFTLENRYDMVVASRFLTGSHRHDRDQRFRYRSLGNRLFTVLANILFFGNLTDTLCQFRGIKYSRLEKVTFTDYDVTHLYRLSIRAMKQRWQVAEIPTKEEVDPSHKMQRHAWGSIFPLLRIILREWYHKD
ncbi:MAG: aminotransferase class I/II-fold pyridoxal phosphate-dependent enzyme [Gemmatimonadota bacterium]|nr:aminotransferase class I/II-fold pyridoxal phosphate-dependent enzyme [Gemmatimonadota bacterium]